jgi:hypothetical protein
VPIRTCFDSFLSLNTLYLVIIRETDEYNAWSCLCGYNKRHIGAHGAA